MTPFTLHTLSDLETLGADAIIDVRAPCEFALDHLPGAINLPVLSDAERAHVGTIYAQKTPFDARKIGGALVAQNTAAHLQGALRDKTGDWQPLVYCWRGGHRSGAFATILSQVGWRVRLLEGGYRSYRRRVVQTLYETPLPHSLRLISGGTGTAKTALLHHLRTLGAQILDLEGLAHHRGSLFGSHTSKQPAQKLFESRIASELASFDPAQITWVEAESSKIGARSLPPSLWSAMTTAPRVEITAPLTARANYLCAAYTDLTENRTILANQIDHLRPFHSAQRILLWQKHVQNGDWPRLAEALMRDHYDPRYAKSTDRSAVAAQHLTLPDLQETTLRAAAETLIKQSQ